MKIYLLNPPFVPNFVRCGRWQGAAARSGGMDYPKWLAYATGVLETKYNDVKLVDAPARKLNINDIIVDMTNFVPDLIVIESNFSSLSNDIEMARLIKNAVSNAFIIIVGPPASQFANQILKNSWIDLVARYEYDFTLLDVANAIDTKSSFKSIKGISYKENGIIIDNPDREYTTSADLDKIPFVSKIIKRHLFVTDYFLSQCLFPEIQIFTGRGCPNRCTFCSWPETLMGRKYRTRSVDNILDEFEYIVKELPEVKEIFIEDDTFTINKKMIIDFCDKLKQRKIKITWSCNSRATLDYETMRKMKKAGCRLLIVGFESGSDEILKTIRKGIDTNQMKKFTKDSKRAGLMVHGDFIIGLPGETRESAEKTLKFIKELKPNILQVAVATPLPGTLFYKWTKDNQYILVDNLTESIDINGYQKCIISYPEFTKKDIESYVARALKEYYLSPFFIPIALSNIFRKNGLHELNAMIFSARSFFKYVGRS